MEFLERVYLGNAVEKWLIALAAAVAAWIAVRVILRIVSSRLGKFAKQTDTAWDDIIVHTLSKTKAIFLLAIGLEVGSNLLTLAPRIRSGIDAFAIIASIVQAGIWATATLRAWLAAYKKETIEKDRSAVTTMSALGFVGQLLIWSVVLLLSLDNLGVDVTALVAGLGVGGVAVALALQNILGDLFSSLAIVLDKPFVLGDFINVGGDFLGSVEAIGLKTTRIRSLSGEQLVFSNSDLLGSRIRNFGRMAERRVAFAVGVTYETPKALLAEIPTIIRRAVEAQDAVRFDRSHFKQFGDFSLDFETVYYVLSPDYAKYMDIQQAINLRLFGEFGDRGIEFAYPTQTLYLFKQPEAAGSAS